MRRLVLETDVLQPEAIALYTSSGYTPIPPFGHYREAPGCRCFAKVLVGDASWPVTGPAGTSGRATAAR